MDLHAKVKLAETIIEFLFKRLAGCFTDHDDQSSCAKIFRPRQVKCTRKITGTAIRGYTRRLRWIPIAVHLYAARATYDSRAKRKDHFGTSNAREDGHPNADDKKLYLSSLFFRIVSNTLINYDPVDDRNSSGT